MMVLWAKTSWERNPSRKFSYCHSCLIFNMVSGSFALISTFHIFLQVWVKYFPPFVAVPSFMSCHLQNPRNCKSIRFCLSYSFSRVILFGPKHWKFHHYLSNEYSGLDFLVDLILLSMKLAMFSSTTASTGAGAVISHHSCRQTVRTWIKCSWPSSANSAVYPERTQLDTGPDYVHVTGIIFVTFPLYLKHYI